MLQALRCINQLGQAEVEHFSVPALGDEDVGSLDVAMDDALGMSGIESFGDENPSVQRNQRVCNGVHCECDPIVHSNLAHQLGNVRLDRAVPDAQWNADFLVRSPFYQHL